MVGGGGDDGLNGGSDDVTDNYVSNTEWSQFLRNKTTPSTWSEGRRTREWLRIIVVLSRKGILPDIIVERGEELTRRSRLLLDGTRRWGVRAVKAKQGRLIGEWLLQFFSLPIITGFFVLVCIFRRFGSTKFVSVGFRVVGAIPQSRCRSALDSISADLKQVKINFKTYETFVNDLWNIE